MATVEQNRCSGSAAHTTGPVAGDALLLVDLQRDFLPGGALAVPHGDRVIEPANQAIGVFAARALPVFASRDWHPAAHCSFEAQGGPWPPHCIAGSPGAMFAAALRLPADARIVSKATEEAADAYSAFGATALAETLRASGVRRLVVAGLATDYCVLHSVLDALAIGFEVVVLGDAIAAVDVLPGDGERAVARMRERGATFVDSAALGAADSGRPAA